MATKPPLALSAVAIDAGGSETTWWSGDKYALNRPQNLSFRTRIGEGFSDAGCTLARRIDRDYTDLELFNDVVFVGDDGQIAYEGRIASTPRSTSGGHSIAVQAAGYMAHAKDQKFLEVYVDRDTAAWGDMATLRKAAWAGVRDIQTLSWNNDNAGLTAAAPNQSITSAVTETWYEAPNGVLIGYVEYLGADTSLPAGWEAPTLRIASDNVATVQEAYGATLDSTLRTVTATTARRYAYWAYKSSGVAATPAVGTMRQLSALAVYGNHGLTLRPIDSTTPDGFYASDVITNIAQRFCPKLNTSGVEDTTLVIPHIAFKERTAPFDAFLLLNGPHGYELAVWENRTLYFRPYDLSDYDWQVRMDQPGVDLSLQGDTTAGLANYAVVEFDNVLTGRRDQVSPSDDSSLEDTTIDHPANKHGLDVELTIGLTFPTTQEVAIAFGQSYLNEFNRPKNRGQITVQGHILDRAGHWQQAWRPRAGETISVVDHPNDAPRLITETSYDDATRTMTISTDSGELNMVEAVVDYIRTSLTAGNLA